MLISTRSLPFLVSRSFFRFTLVRPRIHRSLSHVPLRLPGNKFFVAFFQTFHKTHPSRRKKAPAGEKHLLSENAITSRVLEVVEFRRNLDDLNGRLHSVTQKQVLTCVDKYLKLCDDGMLQPHDSREVLYFLESLS